MSSDLEKFVGEKVRSAAPLVSVVIPAYNVAEFIKATLDSVAAQTFEDFEVIVINDGSPDTAAFEKTLEPFLPSIIYLKQPNRGVSAARNTCIRIARGKYVAFLDGDDIWLPEYLEAQVAFLRSNNVDLVYTDAILFGSDVRRELYSKNAPSRGAVSVQSLIEGSCNVITSGTVVRRASVDGVDGFDETMPQIGSEDFDLWIRLLKSGISAAYQTKALLKYRVRPSSLSGSNVARAERSIIALKIVERKVDLTSEERRVLNSRLERFRKNVALENAKVSLVTKDFEATRSFLDSAWGGEPGIKQRGIRLLLSVIPEAPRLLFRVFRADEYKFIRNANAPSR